MSDADPQTDVDVDVVVIGGGVVGCAVARELSGLSLSVALIEARGDIGDATSKANTAILHTGFDCIPGSLESKFVARGYRLLGDYATRAGIPVEATGALLVAWSQEELDILPKLAAKAAENGYHACEIVDSAAVYEAVPELGPGALGGLTVPGAPIICSWTTALAYATEAKARGCSLLLETAVTGVRIDDVSTTLETTKGEVRARWVVNAAGLGADTIDRLFGFDRFTIVPRRERKTHERHPMPLSRRLESGH